MAAPLLLQGPVIGCLLSLTFRLVIVLRHVFIDEFNIRPGHHCTCGVADGGWPLTFALVYADSDTMVVASHITVTEWGHGQTQYFSCGSNKKILFKRPNRFCQHCDVDPHIYWCTHAHARTHTQTQSGLVCPIIINLNMSCSRLDTLAFVICRKNIFNGLKLFGYNALFHLTMTIFNFQENFSSRRAVIRFMSSFEPPDEERLSDWTELYCLKARTRSTNTFISVTLVNLYSKLSGTNPLTTTSPTTNTHTHTDTHWAVSQISATHIHTPMKTHSPHRW